MSILPIRTVQKVWGRDVLPLPFANPGAAPVGEIWFEPPQELPELLVKYIFAGDKLSVQTHPNSDQAEASGLGRKGKDECWIILDAADGARIAVGFKEAIDRETMREEALDGSIEDKLEWHDVTAGDFFYIPANTVHAIGGGVSLLEIQQNSDITYRLYDYGRPRELHLDDAVAVANGSPHPSEMRRNIPARGSLRLVDGPYFTFDRVDGSDDYDLSHFAGGSLLVIPTSGQVFVHGEAVNAGSCALAADIEQVALSPDALCFLAQPTE